MWGIWWCSGSSVEQWICRRGKLSFGQALFRLVKLTHTRHFSFFFLTITWLASHLKYFTSVIHPSLSNLSTSSSTTFDHFGPNFLIFLLVGLIVGYTLSFWVVMKGSIPFMSAVDHTKIEILSLRKYMILSFTTSGEINIDSDCYAWIIFIDADLDNFLLQRDRSFGLASILCWRGRLSFQVLPWRP